MARIFSLFAASTLPTPDTCRGEKASHFISQDNVENGSELSSSGTTVLLQRVRKLDVKRNETESAKAMREALTTAIERKENSYFSTSSVTAAAENKELGDSHEKGTVGRVDSGGF